MTNSISTKILTILVVLGAVTSATGDDRATLAVLQLKADSVNPHDAGIVTNLLRNYFVNADRYRVLDRDNMDKILHEQSLPQSGITAEVDAARVGRLLNVQKIVVGSLTWFNNAYLLEVSIVDVPTSTIERSNNDHCVSTEAFDQLARTTVTALMGAAVAPRETAGIRPHEPSGITSDAAVTDDSYYRLGAADSRDSSMLTAHQKTALQFRTIGFSAGDYQRFASSGLSQQAWIDHEQKSVAFAGLLGLSPIGSGFFYTNDFGPALFVTLAKAGAIVGMIPFSGKGGEDKNMRWVYPTVLAGATIIDITGSMSASHAYNLRLAALNTANAQQRAGVIESQTISVTLATTW